MAPALRRQDLVGVVLRQEPPDPRRGAPDLPRRRPPDRGRRLGRLAAHRRRDAERLHGRVQGHLVEGATGSRRRATSGGLDPRFGGDRRRQDVARRRRPSASGPASLTARAAAWTGLPAGIAVAVANVDAHVSVPAATVTAPGRMVAVMGTSTCHLVLGDRPVVVEGMCGVVEDGIVPACSGSRPVSPRVGDIFAWFVDHATPAEYARMAAGDGIDVHAILEREAARLRPGRVRPGRPRLVERQPVDPRRCRPDRDCSSGRRWRPARPTSIARSSRRRRSERG